MNSSQYKKLLRVRVPELLEEYILRMEEIWGDDYWKEFQGIGQALYGFGNDLKEMYEQSQEQESDSVQKEEPDDTSQHREDDEDETDQVESKKGKIYTVYWEVAGETFSDKITAATEVHLNVLFKRMHPNVTVFRYEEV